MSKIYECLKRKAEDHNYQNKPFYIQDSFLAKKTYTEYTWDDLYHFVNQTIDYFKSNGLTNQICFLVVNTSFADIVTLIAMMEVGIKPIIVNSDMLYDLYSDKKISNNKDFSYEIIPSVTFNDGIVSIPNNYVLDKRPIDDEVKIVDKDKIIDILYDSFNINNIKNLKDFDFAILTSGTTGKGKVFPIKENDLINRIFNKYDLSKEETFVSQNPISAISGLLFSLYIPIIGDNKKVYVGNLLFTDRDKINNHLNIIVPSNYLSKFGASNKNMALLADNEKGSLTKKIDQITLLGDRASINVIKLIRRSLYRLPKGKIYNYYGRTENLGLISKINEKDMTPVYLYYQEIYPNKIIYSLDKKTVLESEFVDGNIVTKESSIKFNKDLFCEALPVAIMNNYNENIIINGDIFGEIIADNIHTNDYGFKYDNKIYYLGRKNELILTNDNCYYYITGLENGLFRVLISNATHINQNCFCVNCNQKINIYIPCGINEFRCDNYREYRAELNHFISYVKTFNNIGDIFLIDSKNVQYGSEIGKLKRNNLLKLATDIKPCDIDNNKKITSIIEKIIGNELKRNVSLNTKFDYYIFPKNEFTNIDIAKVLSIFKILDYREDDNNIYLVISDEFLFAKEDNIVLNDNNYEEYLLPIKNNTIRDYILKKYNISTDLMLKIGLFHDENGNISAVCSAINSHNVHNDYYLNNYVYYSDIIEKEFEIYVNMSQYDIYSIKHYFGTVFSIDDDNNFYYNNELININPFTSDLTRIMHDVLINNKNNLNIKKMIKER